MSVVVASAVMGSFIPFWGMLADRAGKGRIFGFAALLLGLTVYPVFWGFHNYSDSLVLIFLALIVPFGIIYAAAYASMASLFSEAFDASVRYSSISFVYQFSGIFASGLTPMIAHRAGAGQWSPALVSVRLSLRGGYTQRAVHSLARQTAGWRRGAAHGGSSVGEGTVGLSEEAVGS